jgi:hypothetical protein
MNACSEEQQHILHQVENGYNVVVDACAGSGKSTTILSAAKFLPQKRFLLITYNKSLRKEIKEKVEELQLKNIVVHTYHSLAVESYHPDAHIDREMRLLVQKNATPRIMLTPSDIVVLDEVQDMTSLYFRFVLKYIRDVGTSVQLMILGDYMQGLYEFKGADIRFLTNATDLWKGFSFLSQPHSFVPCHLKTSYRITNPMADFINHVLLNETRLYACREGDRVCYIRRKIHELEKMVVTTIRDLISNHAAKPADIFILGGSVKGPNSVIRRIENALVDANIPCHVPMIENSDHFDEEVIQGKVVFSSFHTSKGRQRPYVFVVGFDHSYFKTIARTMDPEICPNTIYVATTRASKRLYLLESDEWATDRPFKFLKMSHREMQSKKYIDFRGIPRSLFEEEEQHAVKPVANPTRVSPTDLTKFISESVLEEITPLLDTIFVKETADTAGEILLPTTLHTKAGFFEDVSDLNGIAIPAILYDYIQSLHTDEEDTPCILYHLILENIKLIKANKHAFLKSVVENMNPTSESVSDYLYMANVLEAIQERLYFKLKQIGVDEYTWLSSSVLTACKKRMLLVLGDEIRGIPPEIEKNIVSFDDDALNDRLNACISGHFKDRFVFCARTDLITCQTLWELKCTSEISAEHMIQTVVYAWIMRTVDPEFSKSVKIFNIRTGAVLRLEAEKSVLDAIVVSLLKGKYEKVAPPNTADFVADCRKHLSTNL